MVRRLLSLVLLLLPALANGAAFTNATSGLFSAGSTWSNGVAPSASNDTWVVRAGTTVEYDVALTNAPWGACVINGSLIITSQTRRVFMDFLSTVSGTGTWSIGSASLPILMSESNTETVAIAFRSTSAPITMTRSGGLNWYGETRVTNNLVTAALVGNYTNGASTIVLSTNIDCRVGDVLVVSRPAQASQDSTNVIFTVAAYDPATTTVTLGYGTNHLGASWIPSINMSLPRFPGVNPGVLNSVRSNNIDRVGVLSRAVACYRTYTNASGGTTLVSSSNSGLFQGVRFHNNFEGIIGSRTGWGLNYCAFTTGDNGAAFNTCSDSTANYVLSTCVNDGGIGRNCTRVTANYCAVISVSVGGIFSGFQDLTANNCTAANLDAGGIMAAVGTVNLNNGTINNSAAYSVASGGICANANAGGSSQPTSWNVLMSGCEAQNIGNGGLDAYSANVTAFNCTVSNVTRGSIFYATTSGAALNTTRLGTLPADVYLPATFSPFLYTDTVIDQGNLAVWGGYGVASNQTAIAPPGRLFAWTLRSRTTGKSVATLDASTVRPNTTARWSIWLRRDGESMEQYCGVWNAKLTPLQTPLSIVYTNTSSTGVWSSVELTVANTNSAPLDVTVFTVATPTVSTNNAAYSLVERLSDYNTKVIP